MVELLNIAKVALRNKHPHLGFAWPFVFLVVYPLKIARVYILSRYELYTNTRYLNSVESSDLSVAQIDESLIQCRLIEQEYGVDYGVLIKKLTELKTVAILKGSF